jgi:hypothetical protein
MTVTPPKRPLTRTARPWQGGCPGRLLVAGGDQQVPRTRRGRRDTLVPDDLRHGGDGPHIAIGRESGSQVRGLGAHAPRSER